MSFVVVIILVIVVVVVVVDVVVVVVVVDVFVVVDVVVVVVSANEPFTTNPRITKTLFSSSSHFLQFLVMAPLLSLSRFIRFVRLERKKTVCAQNCFLSFLFERSKNVLLLVKPLVIAGMVVVGLAIG